MKKFNLVFVVMMVVSLLIMPLSASAMTEDQLAEKQDSAQVRLDQVDEVSWDDLVNNEAGYKNKIVKVTGVCYYTKNTTSLLKYDHTDGKTIAVQLRSYKWKPDTEYTIVGKFIGIYITEEGNKWPNIVEETHLPYFSEWMEF